MKIALCVPKITENSPQNFEIIKDFIHKCGESAVDFVMFPEACLTGFNYINDRFFGGAFVISKEGTILAEQRLNEEGLLLYEI